MEISERGARCVQNFEGLRLTAYRDAAGVLTIGFGHTGPDVTPGMVITKAQAEALLCKDLAHFARHVSAVVLVPVTQNQFDALCSLAYNIGVRAFRTSTLLRLLNRGDYVGAAAQFNRWNKAGGKVLPGLVKRRAIERALFQEE